MSKLLTEYREADIVVQRIEQGARFRIVKNRHGRHGHTITAAELEDVKRQFKVLCLQ